MNKIHCEFPACPAGSHPTIKNKFYTDAMSFMNPTTVFS
jgi:hypothetical protein